VRGEGELARECHPRRAEKEPDGRVTVSAPEEYPQPEFGEQGVDEQDGHQGRDRDLRRGSAVEGGIEVRDARELRIKESDRIAAIVENLRRMGADVEEFDDGLRVGRSRLKGAVVDSFGDHRVAMSVAIAGLFADGETEISGADCIGISYPAFFETLASIVKH